MNIVVVNGSPRKGNTTAAIEAFIEGVGADAQVEVIVPEKLSISGCKGCNACQCYKGCVATDDSNATVDKLVAADLIVFASPVYWWGITAQMKLLIDKCYCKGAQLKGKEIGLILVGGAAADDEQYPLIKTQFDCMAKYLNWNFRFYKAFSASGKDDLAANEAACAEMREIASTL